jgi:outer membrane protein OmpA-like peptidoglycan-associated protein
VQRACAGCEEETSTHERADHPAVEGGAGHVHRSASSAEAGQVSTPVAASIHNMQGGGAPLPAAIRAFFEPRFGVDFSQVRLHTDSLAADTAKSINAKAFTVGRDIAFSAGQYAPESSAGQHLLAHELTHVVQQRGGEIQRAPEDFLLAGPGQVVQRAACDYDAAEKAKLTGGGRVLAPEVWLLGAIRSGYNAAPNSVVVADFPPGSAVVKGAAAAELSGTYKGILERSTKSYALLGFTDCVTGEKSDPKLRADRARAVAKLLPMTAGRASVIGAAPADDYLMPANASPEERALNRSVLIRLPFEELRESGEVDEYGAGAVGFWRGRPAATVGELIDAVAKDAAAQLDRNGVYQPKVIKGTVKQVSTLAFFEAHSWSITVDAAKMAADLPQPGLTPGSKMSELKIEAVAELASTVYHEFRHAEQSFLSARVIAEEAAGKIGPKELADQLDIPIDAADAAISAAGTVLPDKLKAKAKAWRTFQRGGRHLPYEQWNDALRAALALVNTAVKWDDLDAKDPGLIQVNWEHFLHPVIDATFRRNYSFTADDLLRAIKAGPREPVDADVERALNQTAGKLFIFLATERGGKDLATPDQIARMDPLEAKLAHLKEREWLQQLRVDLLDARQAAVDAYKAYPEEAEAYQTQDLVKASVKKKGP